MKERGGPNRLMIYKQFIMINSITFRITFKTEENYDFTLRLFSSVREVFVHTVTVDKQVSDHWYLQSAAFHWPRFSVCSMHLN